MWSLGVVLFELLALELPFQAQSLPALIIKICSSDPNYEKVSQHYSPAIVDLVRSTLNKRAEKRPDVRDMVRTDLFMKHISSLLSHTLRMGKGGAEGAAVPEDVSAEAAGTPKAAGGGGNGAAGGQWRDPDEVDRSIENERVRQRERELEEERNSKEAQVRCTSSGHL